MLREIIAILSGIGPFLVAAGIYLSIRHFRLSHTVQYMRQLSEPDFILLRWEVDAWLRSEHTDQEKLEMLERDPALAAKVKGFISFLSQVSVAFRFGVVHRGMAIEMWDGLIPHYWEKLKFYFEARRSQGYSSGFNLQRFSEAIRHRKPNINIS